MALPYDKADARAWARETMRGVANVLTPTFTSDLSALNEEATRHDPAFVSGINTYRGTVPHPAVAEALGVAHTPFSP